MGYSYLEKWRWSCMASVFLGLVSFLPMVSAQELPARLLRPLENATTQLSRAHRPEEVDELLDILRELGLDSGSIEELRQTADTRLARAGLRQDEVPSVARTLRQTADRLARYLDDQDAANRTKLAVQLLALHDGQELAHQALGHERLFERWYSPEHAATARRRGEIQDVLRRARHLPIQFSIGESSHPLLQALYGRSGIQLRWGENVIHSVLSLEIIGQRHFELNVR